MAASQPQQSFTSLQRHLDEYLPQLEKAIAAAKMLQTLGARHHPA